MFKKFPYYILIFLFVFNSCQKEDNELHRLKFEIEFVSTPEFGVSSMVEILTCEPNYTDEETRIYEQYIEPGYIWTYEFWELNQNQKISFGFWCQNEYHFIMRIYVDDILLSSKEMVGVDESGSSYYSLNDWGLNDVKNELPKIEFTYLDD